MKIYSLWISGKLSDVNLLTIRSFKAHGHELIIYAYDLQGQVGDCEVRDAREILPESEIFYYKNMNGGGEQWKFGGIAERLKAEMLYQLGGWHIDLDVTCLKPFDELDKLEYVFAPHPSGIIGNIIKAPAKSEFAKQYRDWTKTIDENNRQWTKSFEGLNTAAKRLKLLNHKQPIGTFGMDENQYIVPLLKDSNLVPPATRYAIHWCGAMQWYKNYEEGSFYESLLEKYNIVPVKKKLAE